MNETMTKDREKLINFTPSRNKKAKELSSPSPSSCTQSLSPSSSVSSAFSCPLSYREEKQRKQQVKRDIESLLVYITHCPTVSPESHAARIALNALRNAKFDLATSSDDGDSDDEDEKEDEDADVVQVTKPSTIGDDEQEDWLEWEDLGNHVEDDDDEDSLVDVGNPGMTNSNPTTTNLNNKNKNKTASSCINNHGTAQDLPDMTNLKHKNTNNTANICIHNHGIVQNNPDITSSNPTTTNLNNNNNTGSIYIHNHGIVQNILGMTNSKPTTTTLNHENNSKNKKDVTSIYIHNHGIVQNVESFAPPLPYTTTKLPKECSTNRIHNCHNHNINNINVSNVSPIRLGQSLSQIAISDLSHAGIYVSTPLAALALAIHSALCSHVLNFKCTGIPDDTHTDKRGFAFPARVLPKEKFLPDGWDRRANACREVGKQRYHNQYRYDTNIDIDNHMVSLRYWKKGMGVVVLHIEMLSPHGYDGEDVCTAFTTARRKDRQSKEEEDVNRVEFRVRLRFGPIQGEPTIMIFPLNRHLNLGGFSAFRGDGVKQPAFYYKALTTLMTEFCKVMDLGAVQESSLLTENDESISSKITGVVVGNDTTKMEVAAPHSRKSTSSLSQSVVGTVVNTTSSCPITKGSSLLKEVLSYRCPTHI